MSSAGRIKIDIEAPHPCWGRLIVDGKQVASFHHNELRDLKYVVKKAMREARQRLGKDYRDEV